jgi:hypothetical protein
MTVMTGLTISFGLSALVYRLWFNVSLILDRDRECIKRWNFDFLTSKLFVISSVAF